MAKEITAGCQYLRSHDGTWKAVESVEETNDRQTVYNVSVADYHTYFVGSEDWGFSVWGAYSGSCFTGERDAPQGQTTRVFTTTEGPVNLNRAGTGATNAQTGLPTAPGAGGTFVTPTDITNPAALELHLQRSVPPGTTPRYVAEVEVPNPGLRGDPTGDVRPYHGWVAPNTPGARVVRMWEIRWVQDPRGFEVPTLLKFRSGVPRCY